ncbi:MAG: 4'-phosphopantetheinyl transferase family protein [Hyphomicrobium sp.]
MAVDQKSGVFPVLEHDDVSVVGLDLVASDGQVEQSWPLLSPRERQRADRFLDEGQRRRYAVTRGNLRRVLAGRLRADAAEIGICDSAAGKPLLSPPWAKSGIRFNVSHSGDLAVFALAHGRDVGVDIEVARDVPDAMALAARFYAAEEIDALKMTAPNDVNRAFLACWTRKEAFVKALGLGLRFPLSDFAVSINPDGPATISFAPESTGGARGWTMIGFEPRPNYFGAVVYRAAFEAPDQP